MSAKLVDISTARKFCQIIQRDVDKFWKAAAPTQNALHIAERYADEAQVMVLKWEGKQLPPAA